MEDEEKTDRLREIAGRFYQLSGDNVLSTYGEPFDTTKPNIHDTKAEFLEEVDFVERSLGHVNELIDLMRAKYEEDSALKKVSGNVSAMVDNKAYKDNLRRRVESPVDVVLQGSFGVGLSYTTILILMENKVGLSARKQELESQKDSFWSGSGRAPNHYARTIALRFAKLIAKKTGKKPTFGTARDGNHPSTEFGRALEEIFEILGIEATVKHPATWAIGQLTDEDMKPEYQNFLGNLLNPRVPIPNSQNVFARIAATMAKPEEK